MGKGKINKTPVEERKIEIKKEVEEATNPVIKVIKST